IPTQIGRTCALQTSFKMTIGMFVTGSIISPRIFISTSMFLLHHSGGKAKERPSVHHFAGQRIGSAARYANVHVLAEEIVCTRRSGGREIQGPVPRRPAGAQSERGMKAFQVDLFDGADQSGVLADLDGALLFLHDGETPGLLF